MEEMLRKLKNWRRKNEGAVAIEFAMVSVPFFMLLLGTVEVGLFFASSVVLEGATQAAARVVRMGQAQGDPETAFRDRLCEMVDRLIPCADLRYESIRMPGGTFTEAEEYEPQQDEDGNLIPAGFDPGSADEVVLIRVAYNYTFMTPYIGRMITADSGGSNRATVMSTAVVKNEPYNF